MIKELSTMAVVAVMTTNVTNHFHSVMGAAQDIKGIYQTAGKFNTPDEFMKRTAKHTANLQKFSDQVASLDIQEEVGPFGVMVKK